MQQGWSTLRKNEIETRSPFSASLGLALSLSRNATQRCVTKRGLELDYFKDRKMGGGICCAHFDRTAKLKLTASQGCFDASSADGRFLKGSENEDEN